MRKSKWTAGFSVLLILFGIILGFFLASGLDITDNASAEATSEAESASPDETPASSSNSSGPAMTALSDAFANVAEKVNLSVVTISTKTVIKGRRFRSPFPFPFEEFFPNMSPEGNYTQQGLGSGVIVRNNGVILTNNHVVEDKDDITVRLMDGREFQAEIKGMDPRTDLAVLKIKANNLSAIELGNSDVQRVGEWVLAIGSPLQAEFAHTVTAGIISGKSRSGMNLTTFEDFIQTDAAINPGNSGGALVNLKGELIGINTAIASRSGGNIGIGLAIPSNLANKVMKDILKTGKVLRGWLGVVIQPLAPALAKVYGLKTTEGVFVKAIQKKSPAEKAGLQSEDIIIELNGKKTRNQRELTTRVGTQQPGAKVTLTIIRDSKQKKIDVVIGESPEDTPRLSQSQSRQNKKRISNIGIEVARITPQIRARYSLLPGDQGVVVASVTPGSIAQKAGLSVGSLIMKVNRKTIDNTKNFHDVMHSLKPGDPVVLYVKIEGRRFFISFEIPKN